MNTMEPDYRTLPYASPADRPIGPRVWAASAITMAGLGLLVIGGCFLIGVMMITTNVFGTSGVRGLSSDQQLFVNLLYFLALCAFGGGIWVLVLGLRSLTRLLRI